MEESKVEVKEVVRLDYKQYQVLENTLSRTVPRAGDSPTEYGYMLGIQHALQVIRNGFTIR